MIIGFSLSGFRNITQWLAPNCDLVKINGYRIIIEQFVSKMWKASGKVT